VLHVGREGERVALFQADLLAVLGIWFGTLFMAFHATQGPVFGLPQMIQTRAQLGYRGVVVALFAVLFTYMAFNVADQVLLASGLNGAFGWNATLVAIVTAFLSATALLATMGMNAYGGMLTVLTGIDSFKKIRTSRAWRTATVIVLAAIWYGIGQSISTSGSNTAVSAVLNSLTLMLYLLVPWTALNLVDFFFVRRGHYAITDIFRPDGVYGAWSAC